MVRISLSKHKRKAKTGKTYTYWYLRWFSSDGTQRGHSIGRADGRERLSKRQANILLKRKEQELNDHPGRRDVTTAPRLSEYLQTYLASRKRDLAPGTFELHKTTSRYLEAYFGGNIRIDQITKLDARSFKTALGDGSLKYVSKKPRDLTAATIDGHIRNARRMFNQAFEDDLILYNPFAKLSKPVKVEKDWYYVSMDEFYQLLNACPNRGWRMLLALCRLAGLRQGEALSLTWRDADWGTGDAVARLIIRAPKTKRTRVVPIGPELLPLLQKTFELAKTGESFVVTDIARSNLWRDFQVICRRAGVKPYKRWCQTLRKNREQDWNKDFPGHVVSEWMGHSEEVARRHYLKVYERDMEAAATIGIDSNLAQKLAQLDEKKGFDRVGQNRIDLLQKKI